MLASALALLGLLGAAAGRTELLRTFELKTLDWRQRSFPVSAARDPGITLVFVDQQSLDHFEALDTPWPWPRSLYAAILGFCKAGGAKAVVFDILLTSPSSIGRDQDEALARALRGTNSVLAMETRPESARLPIPLLRAEARLIGDAVARPDPDGVFRRVPLTSLSGGVEYPSLAAATVLAVSRSSSVVSEGSFMLVGDRRVPMTDGRMLLRFRPTGAYPALPAGKVIESWGLIESGEAPLLDPAVVKDRIVLVGLSAPGLKDLRPTPVSETAPGTEVVATAVDDILSGDFLRPAPGAVSALLFVLSLLAGAASAPPRRP